MSIKANLLALQTNLPEAVTLVAVSKTKPNDQILEAFESGQIDFGENYVQELCAKAEALPKSIRWHFIGHLQSNKVKYLAPFVHLIHGVDSLKLLKEIQKQGHKNERKINCLLQIYIAKEDSKFGWDEKELHDFLNSSELEALSNVNICGFMGMASNTDNEANIREEFRNLKRIASKYPQFPIISMGMSSDYLLAIEEGSNMVRIGSLIFGERNYSNI